MGNFNNSESMCFQSRYKDIANGKLECTFNLFENDTLTS